jgi:HlyD family secretion protein
VALGAWQGVRLVLGPAIAVDRVNRGDLIETVVATGSVQTPYWAIIGSRITGTVEDVQVAETEAPMRQLRELTLPAARDSRKQTFSRPEPVSRPGAAHRQGRSPPNLPGCAA